MPSGNTGGRNTAEEQQWVAVLVKTRLQLAVSMSAPVWRVGSY